MTTPSPLLLLSRRRQYAALLAILMMGVLTSGCLTVTIYQPQKAIHRPVVIQQTPDNFHGVRILVRCNAHKDFLPPEDASKLCNGIATDFRRQGAESETVVPTGKNFIQGEVFDGKIPDFTVEIDSKIDHEYDYPLTLMASVLTLTMVPTVAEQTFSQRVAVFGKDGSVLTEEVFRERFIEYGGIGVWSINYLMDWLIRSDDNALSGDAAKEDFTRDFYGQIRQMTFNARIRSEVLGLTHPPLSKKQRLAREQEETQADDVKRKRSRAKRSSKRRKKRKAASKKQPAADVPEAGSSTDERDSGDNDDRPK
ncbi:MAG: hypothetical protein GY822_11435 [Deltaproteobacteria bacterium]|nr:hypothetical protein [Deltaproteobacteria bacterium]